MSFYSFNYNSCHINNGVFVLFSNSPRSFFLPCTSITWGSCSDAIGVVGVKFCIWNQLIYEANAASLWTTLWIVAFLITVSGTKASQSLLKPFLVITLWHMPCLLVIHIFPRGKQMLNCSVWVFLVFVLGILSTVVAFRKNECTDDNNDDVVITDRYWWLIRPQTLCFTKID